MSRHEYFKKGLPPHLASSILKPLLYYGEHHDEWRLFICAVRFQLFARILSWKEDALQC